MDRVYIGTMLPYSLLNHFKFGCKVLGFGRGGAGLRVEDAGFRVRWSALWGLGLRGNRICLK